MNDLSQSSDYQAKPAIAEIAEIENNLTADYDYKRLLDNIKTGVMLVDGDLRLLYLNTAAENLLETSDRKAKGLRMNDVFIGASEDIEEIRQAIHSHSSYTKHEAELRLLNGKQITTGYTLNTFEQSNNYHGLLEFQPPGHSQRISRDETFSSTHETTRNLVRGLAHEIKNPLGGIRGAAQLLAAELPSDDLKDYTNVIIEEADRLRNLVDRLAGSRKLPDFQSVNIHQLLERVKSLVEAEINDQSIKLIRDYDPSIPEITGDAEQLIQALLNIVRNAMQAQESPVVDHSLGEIVLKTRIARNVTMGSAFHRLAATIEIIDNGPGIPRELIKNVFYPMISGRASGTGMGLSITHSIVSLHKGTIECQSDPGKTVFTITVPLMSAETYQNRKSI